MKKAAKGSITEVKMEKKTYSPWYFPDSGDFMVCTDGENGGTVPEWDLFPAFDLEHEDGATHWCVRSRLLGGDSEVVAEVFDGAGTTLLRGVVVDGHKLTEGEADSMQHEVRAYIAALFSMSLKMQVFLRDRVTNGNIGRDTIIDDAQKLLLEIYTRAGGK